MIRRFALFFAVAAIAAAMLVGPVLAQPVLAGSAPAATAAGRSVPDQEILADGLFRDAAALDSDEVSAIAALYRRVVEECPDTEYAREALWNLSSLAMEKTPPDWKEAAASLELFLKRYPDAPDAASVVERLLLVYGESHRHADALPLFERLLKTPEDIPSDDLPDVWFRYARSLEGAGKKNEAKTWYARVCSEAPGTDAARLARERLEAMK